MTTESTVTTGSVRDGDASRSNTGEVGVWPRWES